MIFRHQLLDQVFVYDDEECRSFYIEDDFDNLIGKIPYEWERFLNDHTLCMLAPTVIDRW